MVQTVNCLKHHVIKFGTKDHSLAGGLIKIEVDFTCDRKLLFYVVRMTRNIPRRTTIS